LERRGEERRRDEKEIVPIAKQQAGAKTKERQVY